MRKPEIRCLKKYAQNLPHERFKRAHYQKTIFAATAVFEKKRRRTSLRSVLLMRRLLFASSEKMQICSARNEEARGSRGRASSWKILTARGRGGASTLVACRSRFGMNRPLNPAYRPSLSTSIFILSDVNCLLSFFPLVFVYSSYLRLGLPKSVSRSQPS
jgi:hypothetical protein